MKIEQAIKKLFDSSHPVGYLYNVETIGKGSHVGIKKKNQNITVLIKPPKVHKNKYYAGYESVNFNCDFKQVEIKDKKKLDFYFLLELTNSKLLEVFIFWVDSLIQNIDSKTTCSDQINQWILEYIQLMQSAEDNSKGIQGLWSELLLIAKSSNVEYYLNSWHSNKLDKLDFTDGSIALDVKSSALETREHKTNFNQLSKYPQTYIASFLAITESDNGISISDLKAEIISEINNQDLIKKLNKQIISVLGTSPSFNENISKKFNHEMALANLNVYDVSSFEENLTVPDYIKKQSLSFKINLDNELPVIPSASDYQLINSVPIVL